MGEREQDWAIGRELERKDATIAQLREALIEAKICIVNYHDQAELDKVGKFLVKIDRALGLDQTKPKG